MKKVKNLPRRISKNGKYLESCAIFLCEHCKQEVEKRLSDGYKCESCGCKKGELISKAKIGEKNPQFGKKGADSPNFGKIVSEETKQKLREANKGHIVSEETKQKMRDNSPHLSGENHSMYGVHRFGELAANWQGGKSFEIYPKEFSKGLKQQILERDNYTCQDPNCNLQNHKLMIHHIDYNKLNNNPENLTTLCNSCHSKTNGKNNRQYWIEFYQNIIISRIVECLL